MDNQTQAEVRRYVVRAAIQLLAQKSTDESVTERENGLCHILWAALLQQYYQSRRMDHILRRIQMKGPQHPAILELARQIEAVFTDLRDDLLLHFAEQLKSLNGRQSDSVAPTSLEAAISEASQRRSVFPEPLSDLPCVSQLRCD